MSVMPYVICLWPGLPPLWLRGEWRGLAAAAVFAALLNFVLISTWIWPEWIEGGWQSTLWWIVSLWWVGAFFVNAWRLNEEVEPKPTPDAEALFREAQATYLLGDWFPTEAILLQLLENSPNDAEARLLLATVYRRRGRWTDAWQSLAQMERLDAAKAWHYEIAAERQLLASKEKGVAETDSPAADEDRESTEDAEAASVPMADKGKKVRNDDDPSQRRRAA